MLHRIGSTRVLITSALKPNNATTSRGATMLLGHRKLKSANTNDSPPPESPIATRTNSPTIQDTYASAELSQDTRERSITLLFNNHRFISGLK